MSKRRDKRTLACSRFGVPGDSFASCVVRRLCTEGCRPLTGSDYERGRLLMVAATVQRQVWETEV